MPTRILAGAFLGAMAGGKVAELSGQGVLGLIVGVCVWTGIVCVGGAGAQA